jgi:hypothetical protein
MKDHSIERAAVLSRDIARKTICDLLSGVKLASVCIGRRRIAQVPLQGGWG